METFEWDSNFITGLPDVDDQHRTLVNLFNELSRSLFHGSNTTTEEMEAIFHRLTDYATHHFTEEEALMAACGLDERHLSVHRRLHRQFVDQVQGMWALRHSLRQPSETIMGFLTSWLGLHILGMDQSMARQMQHRAQGLSPAEAYEQENQSHDQSTQALLKMVGNLYHVLAEQNADLASANQLLEERVQQRTQALAEANAELQAANAQLKAFSHTDGLLGIANRACFDERLQEEVGRARRHGQPLAVLMMDVDFFKRYNDSHGHPAGDACLKTVVRAVGGVLVRRTDFLARYGGEELVALLPDTPLSGAIQVAERVVEAVYAAGLPHGTSDAAAVVTLSVGVASAVPTQADDAGFARDLLAQADTALYRAKHAGRSRAVAFEPD